MKFFGVSVLQLQQNLIQPRKRPLSFLLPTIVRPSKGMCGTYLCLGANNGDKALSSIVQVGAALGAAAGLSAEQGPPIAQTFPSQHPRLRWNWWPQDHQFSLLCHQLHTFGFSNFSELPIYFSCTFPGCTTHNYRGKASWQNV